MTMMTPIELHRARSHARRTVLKERIAELWSFRRWYREVARSLLPIPVDATIAPTWADLERENTAECVRLGSSGGTEGPTDG